MYSATPQINRAKYLAELLRATWLHPRLVNGSDYPLPAIDALIRMGSLVGRGVLDEAEKPLLREVFDRNPLEFDLVLKRRLRMGSIRFPARAFMPGVLLPGG